MALRIGPYVLVQRVVPIRGKESPIYEPRRDVVVIHYFHDTRQGKPAPLRQVIEHMHTTTLNDEGVAEAFMNIGGLSPETAARIVAANKAGVERLSPYEAAIVYRRLLYYLRPRQPE